MYIYISSIYIYNYIDYSIYIFVMVHSNMKGSRGKPKNMMGLNLFFGKEQIVKGMKCFGKV